MAVTYGWGRSPRGDVFLAYWVLFLERGRFTMHLRLPPHPVVPSVLGEDLAPWSLENANDFKAMVCPHCLWHAIAPGQLAEERTEWIEWIHDGYKTVR